MQLRNQNAFLFAIASISILLGGCISSPLPGGTVGALYQWDDLETPVVTTQGIHNPRQKRFHDGEFSLMDLPLTHPELSGEADYPWLFEACNEEQCYSIVLFANDFKRESRGMLSGNVSMNALTTLMANEVRGQPADSVRSSLDSLSGSLTYQGLAHYPSLIKLDFLRNENSRDVLLYPSLFSEATTLHDELPAATVQDLLGREINKTGDLDASTDFEFDSSWQLAVDVDLPSWRDTSAYLLLCVEYEVNGDAYKVDYSSCTLRAPLQAGVWQGELKLTAAEKSLAVVLMPLNNPNDPTYAVWERAVDGDVLMMR